MDGRIVRMQTLGSRERKRGLSWEMHMDSLTLVPSVTLTLHARLIYKNRTNIMSYIHTFLSSICGRITLHTAPAHELG